MKYLTFPAVLKYWWEKSEAQQGAIRLAHLESFNLDEAHANYLKYKHNVYENKSPGIETIEEWEEEFGIAIRGVKGGANSKERIALEEYFNRKKAREAFQAAQEAREKLKEKLENAEMKTQIKLHVKNIGLKTTGTYSRREIELFVRKQFMKYHPDKNPNDKDLCKARFQEISHAWDELKKILDAFVLTSTPAFTE